MKPKGSSRRGFLQSGVAMSRPSVREAILTCLRRRGVDVGEGAMIVTGEWGYWVGSEYVAKSEISRVMSEGVV